jgi:hypothetical protein
MKARILISTVILSAALALLFLVGKSLPRSIPIDPVQASTLPSSHALEGKYVVVHTDSMKVDLMEGTTTLKEFPILTIGKPDSYYETIGGMYESDYKIRSHFSSIGHVYMPWSVHIFGNFFIHGIPYYPGGAEVSSAYSGGCVRLNNADAEELYDFVEPGMPIVITEHSVEEFAPTATGTPTLSSMDMTRLMAGVVSLEVLTQDTRIMGPNGKTTTRRMLLPDLVKGNDAVIAIYAQDRGEEVFLDYMNKKAQSLGLTNTTFTAVSAPASTTPEEFNRFMTYIQSYKTYLYALTLEGEPSR